MRLVGTALALAASPLFLPAIAFAQWLDQIQTESDWEYFYSTGYYDYNTYQIYRDLTEGIIVSDTSGFLIDALGNPPSEMTGNDFLRTPEPVAWQRDSMAASDNGAPHLLWRNGHKLADGGTSGYILVAPAWRNLSMEYKARHDNDSWMTDRRSLNTSLGDYAVTIGNYTADVGMGLGIGRYDYRPLSYDRSSDAGRIFIFPDNSYYNGLRINYRGKLQFLLSAKEYGDLRKDFLGCAYSIDGEVFRLGLSASATSLASDDSRRNLGTGSLFFSNPTLGVETEIAYSESGAGACLQLRRSHLSATFWHYDDGFVNLQSSGPAYPDYRSYGDLPSGLSFRQAQAGETGGFLRYVSEIRNLQYSLSCEAWKRSPGDPLGLDNAIQARFLPRGNIAMFAKFADRVSRTSRRSLAELGTEYHKYVNLGAFMSLWIEHGRANSSKSIYSLYCSAPVLSQFIVSARARWNLHGEFDYFVEEKMVIYENLMFKATYRWQRSDAGRLGPLYVVMEASL